MGVVFISVTATDEVIRQLHKDPPLIWRLYSPENKEMYLSAIGSDRKPNFISRFFGAKEVPVPEPLPEIKMHENDRIEIDLDKSWDGINFCLKKLVPKGVPNLFEDGKKIGHIEVGYGPAMSFLSQEVKQISDAYAQIGVEKLLTQFDPDEMKGVYPKTLWKKDNEETREYLYDNFMILCNYLTKAVKQELGMIVVYT